MNNGKWSMGKPIHKVHLFIRLYLLSGADAKSSAFYYSGHDGIEWPGMLLRIPCSGKILPVLFTLWKY